MSSSRLTGRYCQSLHVKRTLWHNLVWDQINCTTTCITYDNSITILGIVSGWVLQDRRHKTHFESLVFHGLQCIESRCLRFCNHIYRRYSSIACRLVLSQKDSKPNCTMMDGHTRSVRALAGSDHTAGTVRIYCFLNPFMKPGKYPFSISFKACWKIDRM